MLEHSQPRSSRGVSGDDPEGGARRGVLRRRLVTARLGRQGPRPPGTTTWVRGARCTDPKATARRCRTAGAQRRRKRGPGSPKSPRWSAERRASRVMGRKAPRKRLACRVMCRPNGCFARTRTFLGAPPHPRFGVGEAKDANPGRGKCAAGRRRYYARCVTGPTLSSAGHARA